MKLLRSDFDPIVAPDKTGQDVWGWLVGFCRAHGRDGHGFTRVEVDTGSRANSRVVRQMLDRLEAKGGLLVHNGRYYPLDALYGMRPKDFLDESLVVVPVLPKCRAANTCRYYDKPEAECWRHLCGICGPSNTHWPSQEDAQAAIDNGRNHKNRKSHRFAQKAALI